MFTTWVIAIHHFVDATIHFLAFAFNISVTGVTLARVRSHCVETTRIKITLVFASFTLIRVFDALIVNLVVIINAMAFETAGRIDAIGVLTTMMNVFGALINFITLTTVPSVS